MNTGLEVQSRLYALTVFLANLLRFFWRQYGPLRIFSMLLLVVGVTYVVYAAAALLLLANAYNS